MKALLLSTPKLRLVWWLSAATCILISAGYFLIYQLVLLGLGVWVMHFEYRTIELVAFDDHDRQLGSAEFFRSWLPTLIVRDRDGSPVLGMQYGLGAPKVAVASVGPVTLEMLWNIPGFGRVLVAADNQGRGYEPPRHGRLRIELLPEFARSRVARVRLWVAQHNGGLMASAEARRNIDTATELLNSVQVSPDSGERSRLALEALRLAMWAGESEVLAEARDTIRRSRRGSLRLIVRDNRGNPLPHLKVHFNQTQFDFLFGAYSDGYDAQTIELMRSLGLNYAMLLMTWDRTEPNPGEFSLDYFDRLFEPAALRIKGFTLCEHGMVWFKDGEVPAYLAESKGNTDAVVAAVNHHVPRLLSHYGEQIQIWESLNEGHPQWSRWDLNDQGILRVAKASADSIRKQAPRAPIMVDVALPLGEDVALKDYPLMGAISRGRVGDRTAEGFRHLKRLSAAGVPFDVIALQFFEGAWVDIAGGLQVPAIDVFRLACELDRFKRFGKPLQLAEIAVGSSHRNSWMASMWHAPANQVTQADYLEDVFTLAYGDLQVEGINWWGFNDTYRFVIDGGLYDPAGRPKLAAVRLQKLLEGWRSSGDGVTGSDGAVDFEGAPGQYFVSLVSGGCEVGAQAHIAQGTATTVTVVPVEVRRSTPDTHRSTLHCM
ncbi:MAG TPA: endo-1,4-beta-xylanase [Candidatus Binatus sp.]|uniref:endo-1,4-beta-xylanase n=1 Tax=Candidatus Binatus sp. TaxID=2811406 RepID=UPI002B48D883|nr:endo-1,4-beta-xylanase [Candidatus Binatus sp.]HKN12551.1 endo-1,4-beta-xylanase [Candidatus Binatus sp.]